MELFNERDRARLPELEARRSDWRNGTVVYQVFVDRFASSRSDLPEQGVYDPERGAWTHELEFWGGTLAGVRERLDYLQSLGVEVVYLNPIFEAGTNHKYDTWDYERVDPSLGDRAELRRLADDLHARGMRLMLDGVFNHVGRGHRLEPSFVKPRGWMDVENLPELDLEKAEVWSYVVSVVQSYLREEGIDGWRLDVAFDLGFTMLRRLTVAAHEAKPGCAVIGEIWNYPEEWHPAVDGVMNMHGRALILALLDGRLEGPVASAMWETMVAEAGYEPMLKAWLVLDNHDTPRLATALPAEWQQKAARVLQFTLPGTVCLYYGSEVGMEGGPDPANRAPMRWDLVSEGHPMLEFHRRLLSLRSSCPALRWGDFRRLHSAWTFAFLRRTVSASETVVVVVNPHVAEVTEFLQLRESKLQDVTLLRDALSDAVFTVYAGCVEVRVPPGGALVLQPETEPTAGGYHRYARLP